MKRSLALVSIATLSTSIFVAPPSLASAPSPKVGVSCSKAGKTYRLGSTSLICSKKGKRLLWKKYNAQAVPPTPSPTPTPAQTVVAPIPIALPVGVSNDPNAITFANLTTRVADIRSAAFQKGKEAQASALPSKVNIDLRVGPNTVPVFVEKADTITKMVNRTSAIFNGFSQTKNLIFLVYNATDEPWAENEWKSIAKERGYDTQFNNEEVRIKGNCQVTVSPGNFSGPVTDCGGSNATSIIGSDDVIIELGMPKQYNSFFASGDLVGHEFTHAIQGSQWIGINCRNINGRFCFMMGAAHEILPCWINEGQPNVIGRLVANDSLEGYRLATQDLFYGQGPTTVTDYTESSLLNLLLQTTAPACYSKGDVYRLGYTVGALTTEILVAIGGPQATMALYALAAQGVDFQTAFKKVYAIEWTQAAKAIANVLAAEYATAGPPPR